MLSNFLFRKSCLLRDNVEIIVQPDMPHDRMAHAHFTQGTLSHKHTPAICNTYCFSTATLVAPKRLHVTLYEQYIVCLVDVERINASEF